MRIAFRVFGPLVPVKLPKKSRSDERSIGRVRLHVNAIIFAQHAMLPDAERNRPAAGSAPPVKDKRLNSYIPYAIITPPH